MKRDPSEYRPASPGGQADTLPRGVTHVVGAAIVSDGRILVTRRGADMDLSGLWEFPGGKVEDGEEPEAALARELEEELAVRVVVEDFVARGTWTSATGREVVLDVYRCRLSPAEQTIVLTEHAAYGWYLPAQLASLEWAPADIPAVKALEEALSEPAPCC